MGQDRSGGGRRGSLGDRLRARLAARARPQGPVLWPEPRVAGELARARQILKGRWRIGERLVEAPGQSVWEIAPETPEALALHGMGWLDDLAAEGSAKARLLAQEWVGDWIARHGGGTGPGWVPELAADRLLRLLGHARFLLHPPGVGEERLGPAVAATARFLEARWRHAPQGRGQVAALAALIQAGLALPERRAVAVRAAQALGEEARRLVDAQGGVASRDPEELLDLMDLLVGANRALVAGDLPPDPAVAAAVGRAAPVLRALRHADGGLARFHGGCRGTEGRVDQVLAAAGRPPVVVRGGVPLHMGYLRLAAGRTTVIADAAAPPTGPASVAAHASTLAFELTSGRRPLVVSIGPGRSFGGRWRRAARATPSHSTLSLDTVSSSRLGPAVAGEAGERLVEVPGRVLAESAPGSDGLRVEMAHDGWRPSHGLTHARLLQLLPDGRALAGEDMLTTLTAADGAAFDRAMNASSHVGLPFALRFHLHPDVEAEMAADGSVAILLPSGEEWVFAQEGGEGLLGLEPSVYLEEGRLRPRPTLQIVIEGRALRPTTRLRWTLAKAYGTPEGLRDLNPRADWDEEDE
ncbi:heparinase II/III family protein [Rubellimicrobium roseum]|uniref:Heparinase n=1 Tax=Rubellimicrobium roseum TaxID=687525 RepID=A0A5C4NJ24_9RHOB|nr:heparinase II/III family protein [Rubellimicrobium roseum]TNC72399.1 heparinase [Rubellimicrobium roseum]